MKYLLSTELLAQLVGNVDGGLAGPFTRRTSRRDIAIAESSVIEVATAIQLSDSISPEDRIAATTNLNIITQLSADCSTLLGLRSFSAAAVASILKLKLDIPMHAVTTAAIAIHNNLTLVTTPKSYLKSLEALNLRWSETSKT